MIYNFIKLFIVFFLIVTSSKTVFANEDYLQNFKKEFFYNYEKIQKSKLKNKKTTNEIELNLDKAFSNIKELLNYIENKIKQDEINDALLAMDFLDLMFKKTNSLIPKRYKLNLEELDLSKFTDQELLTLQAVLKDLDKSKINSLRESINIISSMKVIEFPVNDFLKKMAEANIRLNSPRGMSSELDFNDFSLENIDKMNESMDELEDKLTQIDLDSLNENINNIDVAALSVALAELDTSVIADSIGDVSNEVGDYISASSNNSSGIIWAQTCSGGVCVEMDNPTDQWLSDNGFN